MYTVPTIPGVKLEVYKENRLLAPESDGYVTDGYGKDLCSGSATILAIVGQNAGKTIGLFRDGQDHYILQKELLGMEELRHGKFPPTRAQQFMRELLADRSFTEETRIYGVKMPLRINDYNCNPVNTVHYPENMLALAQYVRDAGRLTGRVHVWEVALVSQDGKFFLTVYRHYNIPACHSVRGPMCFPRLKAHRLLEKLLVESAPADLPLIPAEDIVPMRATKPEGLGRYEAIVDRWYGPRDMGAIVTVQGPARVHWQEVPPRPRRRFLEEGEKVRFSDLRVPQKNPKTDWRKMRKARFELDACGIEIG